MPLTFDPSKFQNLPKIQDILKQKEPPKEINGTLQERSYSFQKKNSYNSKKGVSSRYNEFTSEEEPAGPIIPLKEANNRLTPQ